jgi:hypothetical protein
MHDTVAFSHELSDRMDVLGQKGTMNALTAVETSVPITQNNPQLCF